MRDLIDIAKIGVEIQSRRKKQGLTIEGLALEAEIAPLTLSHIEHGRSPAFALRQLCRIAFALGMPSQELFAVGVEQNGGEKCPK